MELINLFTVLNCEIGGTEIPVEITNITSLIYTVIKIGVPLLLILFGMWDFGKSVMAGKEDEIKANQKLFIKRLISAAAVFLIFSLVSLVIGLVAPNNEGGNIMDKVDCIINGQ